MRAVRCQTCRARGEGLLRGNGRRREVGGEGVCAAGDPRAMARRRAVSPRLRPPSPVSPQQCGLCHLCPQAPCLPSSPKISEMFWHRDFPTVPCSSRVWLGAASSRRYPALLSCGSQSPPKFSRPPGCLMQGFPLSRPVAPCCLCPPSSQTLCGGSLSLPQHHRPRDGGSIPCQPPALGVPQNPSAPVPYRNGDGQWSSSLDPLPKMKRRQHLLCLLITNGGGETEGGGVGRNSIARL